MSRITLAFRLLFTGKLPAEAAAYLPESAQPKKLPEASSAEPESKPQKNAPTEPARKPRSSAQSDGALAMLGLLQREGRLVDFLQESLDDYEDSDIGAAVRDIHRGCAKVLKEHLTIEAVMPGEEDDKVKVPDGFDPGEIRLVGEVRGEPPFDGVLRHHGWRVTDTRLPKLSEGIDRRVLAPAEVEVP
jgi:hypothetical protein